MAQKKQNVPHGDSFFKCTSAFAHARYALVDTVVRHAESGKLTINPYNEADISFAAEGLEETIRREVAKDVLQFHIEQKEGKQDLDQVINDIVKVKRLAGDKNWLVGEKTVLAIQDGLLDTFIQFIDDEEGVSSE